MSKLEYTVAWSGCVQKLEANVNLLIDRGWEPLGALVANNSDGVKSFYQAMIKRKDEKKVDCSNEEAQFDYIRNMRKQDAALADEVLCIHRKVGFILFQLYEIKNLLEHSTFDFNYLITTLDLKIKIIEGANEQLKERYNV